MRRQKTLRLVGPGLVLALLLALAGSALAQGPADPVINEFVFNHTDVDTHEYVEIFGSPNTDYSAYRVLQIEGDGTGAGTIDSVTTIQTTDSNGIWMTGFLNNTFENGTVSLLLVEGFTGAVGNDLDTDNDGVLDATPWTRLVDSIAVSDGGAGDWAYGGVVLAPGFDGGSFTVGGASRIPNGVDTDSTTDWVRNDFDGAGLPGFAGTPEVGEAYNTPGANNDGTGGGGGGEEPPALADPVINEFVANTAGTDFAEYVEVYGEPNGDYSAFVVLEIEGDSNSNMGTVDRVFQVGTTNVDGLWVGHRSGIENGSISLLLVEGFTGGTGDDLDVNNDGVLDITPWTRIVDSVAVNDGGPADRHYAEVTLGPNFDGVSFAPGGASRIPDGADTNTTADWVRNDFDGAGLPGFPGTPVYGEAYNTPGLPNAVVSEPPPPPLACGDPATPIGVVQGTGLVSPLAGDTVVVEGIVVGDFQENNQLRGFFLQDLGDGDPATSDGIFVFEATPTLDLNVGDVVILEATVSEYYELTQLSGVAALEVCDSGVAVPAPALITLPLDSVASLEAYEGMLVELSQPLTVTENYTLGRYGEVHLAAGGRLFNPTNVVMPGPDALALQAANDLRRIQIDDGSTWQNPVPLPPYFAPDGTLRSGDTTEYVLGVLSFAFGEYEVHPVAPVEFARANPRPATPAVGGDVRVASFNVLNYFNGDGQGGGFPTSRGANTLDEFNRQRDKIIAAILELDADVIGLMEIENDGYGDYSAIQDLVNGLNALAGAGTYAFIDPGLSVIGTDEIAVGLLYQPAVVTPFGAAVILDSSVDPAFIDTKNRPVLIQTFEEVLTGARFTVAVNHLKSKGTDCNDIGDPDTGDGQGTCNLTRLAAAQALASYLATDPTGSGDPDFLIIGDLNSYAMEDPIRALRAAGYTDLLQTFVGEWAYTYVFAGQAGYLDHALAIEHLVPQVTGAAAWHINADEPVALDYNDYNQPELYNPDPYKSSDHDPVLVGLLLEFMLELDVKPGNSTDPVNFGSNGKLPAAIYSTPTVDATLIAPETLFLAGAPVAQTGKGYMVQYRDVNGDGLVDLFAHFETALLELPADGSTLMFEGVYNGRRVYGTDDVRLVPVPGMSCIFSQDAWAAVFGPEGPNATFLHGRTVAQVMEVRGNGHRWYSLAQAAITTRLLEADGVVIPDGLAVTLVEAESRLEALSPDGALKRDDRLIFEDLANVLNAFNTEAGCAP